MIECVKDSGCGAIIDVHVVPNSKRDGLGYDEFSKRLRVKVCAPAIDGKANKHLIDYLKGVFGPCEIVSGQTSRKKTVLVPGTPKNEVIRVIEVVLGE